MKLYQIDAPWESCFVEAENMGDALSVFWAHWGEEDADEDISQITHICDMNNIIKKKEK